MTDPLFDPRVLFRNRDGEPIDIDTLAYLLEHDDYKRVAQDVIGDSTISTVWLGVVHPGERIFETMVFGGAWDSAQWRWVTEAEALIGHASICHRVRDTPTPPERERRATYEWSWWSRAKQPKKRYGP